MRISPVIKGVYKTDYMDIVYEGNREIGLFIGEVISKLEMDKSYWLSRSYHTDWNELMKIITKVKHKTYKKGYELFSKKHKAYLRMCNGCYDADIQEAWNGCVDCCRIFNNKQENIKEIGKIISSVKSKSFITVSLQAIDDFQKQKPKTFLEYLEMNTPGNYIIEILYELGFKAENKKGDVHLNISWLK